MPFPLPFRKNKHAQDPELEHSTDHSSPPASVIAVTEKEANVSNDRRASTPSNRAEAILEEVRKETADHEGEDLIEYPRAAKLAVITLALCLSVFCMALDNTIIATAIPRITDQFHSVGDVGWYGSAYLLTTCALQLFFGKLYAYYSIKWVYLMAFAIFEIGSAVCGAAPNSIALIIGRAVAGIGSAGIFTVSFTLASPLHHLQAHLCPGRHSHCRTYCPIETTPGIHWVDWRDVRARFRGRTAVGRRLDRLQGHLAMGTCLRDV